MAGRTSSESTRIAKIFLEVFKPLPQLADVRAVLGMFA
jgi:hypothetical protein